MIKKACHVVGDGFIGSNCTKPVDGGRGPSADNTNNSEIGTQIT